MRRLALALILLPLSLCELSRAGLVEIAPATALDANASAALSAGDNNASDQKQLHDGGGVTKPSANVIAHASIFNQGLLVTASASADLSLDVSDSGFSLAGSAIANVPGKSPISSATAQAIADLPFALHQGIGRFDFAIDIQSASIAGDTVLISLNRIDPADAEIVFQHTFTQSYSKHFVDRLEAGEYRLKVDAKASADSLDAATGGESDSVSYRLSVAPSDVPPSAIPLPAGVWLGSTGFAAALLFGRRRFLGWPLV